MSVKRRTVPKLKRALAAYLLVVPAALFYGFFVLRSITQTAQYSLYDWNGITPATWAGLDNYVEVFTNPKLVGAILNSFELIIYFSFIPVLLALFAANVIRGIATSRLAGRREDRPLSSAGHPAGRCRHHVDLAALHQRNRQPVPPRDRTRVRGPRLAG